MVGKSLLGLFLLFGVSGSTYLGYEIFRPKNIAQYLEWKGYKLVNDENTWEAIYQENKDDLSSILGTKGLLL